MASTRTRPIPAPTAVLRRTAATLAVAGPPRQGDAGRPRPAPPPTGPPEIVLDSPPEVLGAAPVMLGFHPRESLVLLSTHGAPLPRIGLTMRTDLPPRPVSPAQLTALAESAVATLLRDAPDDAASAVATLLRDAPDDAAVLVLAGSDGADPPYRQLVDAVVTGLACAGTGVHTAVWAESTAGGARWACYGSCGCTGTLPDPATTPLAAAAVADGLVVRASRAEVEALVAAPDPARLRRREELLVDVADALDTAPLHPADALRVVDEALADAAEGALVLDDVRVVELARALATPAVRDRAMQRCFGPTAEAAERLWLALVRETPDPEAAEPAALLAVSALLRGDGALANVALDRAERAWPGHRLSRLLRSVTGLAPEQVRRVLRECLAGARAAGRRAGGVRPAGGSARSARRRRPSC